MITNKMVSAAMGTWQKTSLYGRRRMRAALEAALAVRKQPDNAEVQAEEIADLKAELIPSRELIDTLRAERAELIEALRRLSKPRPDGGWNFPTVRVEERHQQSARAILERIEGEGHKS